MLRHGRASWLGLLLTLAVVGCSDDPPVVPPNEVDPPTGLAGVAASERQIDLTWTAAASAGMYRVERQVVGGAFTQIGEVTGTAYSDMNLNPATPYSYRVRSVHTDGTTLSIFSDPVSVVTDGVEIIGNINADANWTADNVYVLKGVVTVQNGVTLTVQAGTRVLGDKATQGALLLIRGARLVANGTEADPIIFTSVAPEGSRQKGDWGGIIINGRSNCNFPAGECLGEGNTGVYGGTDPLDNSGILRYVRVEFAGIEFSPDNELNLLTLNGVGRGTVIEHVQTHAGLDDGIELFGGTVDMKWVYATYVSDDSFDWSTGWQGRAQFMIAQQDPDDGDTGWEIDNNEGGFERLPRTYGQVYNFTLVGKPAGAGTAGESTRGIQFRRGYGGVHSCGIVMGFGLTGLDIDDAATERLANNDSLQLTNTTFFDNGREQTGFASPGINFDPDSDTGGAVTNFEETWAMAGGKNNTVGNPMLTDPYDLADPDFSPAAGSPVIAGGCTPPNDGFFTNVAYRGAVADANDTWYKGWTTTEVPGN